MTIALTLFQGINQNSMRKLYLTVQLLKGQMGITQRQRVPKELRMPLKVNPFHSS